MMLYVFHVDVGRMMSFDMTVALSSVANLKETIERLHLIPAANIVLLASGGEMLEHSSQVSCYSAGTDTNPIYMFLTGDVRLPAQMPQIESDLDLRRQVDDCLKLPAVLDTVVRRAQLALHMYELARDEERSCERLVHDQHLQQQGWSAVVANMEDCTNEFRQRFRSFCSAFDRHFEKRDVYLELLHHFNDDVEKLSRIPILPGLMALAEDDFHGFDEFFDNDDVFTCSQMQQDGNLMLKPPPPPTTTTATATDDVAGNGEKVTGKVDESSAISTSDDKSSTSPNKKLKMGDDTTEVAVVNPITATAGEDQQRTSQTSISSSITRRPIVNLLQWITSKKNHIALRTMCEECVQGLGTFNIDQYDKTRTEVLNIIKIAEQSDVKEIKGLGERLCRLEEFKYKIKKMVQDQKELSTAFQQNQSRAMNLRDASILPDLCASHRSQLQVMLQNHQKIRDHCRCITKAKDELGNNLHARLKRIVWIENGMSEYDNRLLFYHRCLRRAERHINIIEQIHQAPCIYVAAVTEVVRRRIFSGEFRQWASKLAEDFDTIHSEEIKRRQQFNASFDGHFLDKLFPGMNDMPPAFANENPLIFDARLPNLTRSDVDMLASHMPEFTTEFQLPDMEPVIRFFVSRSGEHQRERLEELLKQETTAALLNMEGVVVDTAEEKPLQHLRLGKLQKQDTTTGCDESETDTETEFEKVPISSGDVGSADIVSSTTQIMTTKTAADTTITATVSTSTMDPVAELMQIARSTTTEQLLMQSAGTLTDENESIASAELARLRDALTAMSKLAMDCLQLARHNLSNFRHDTANYREDLQSELQMLGEKWNMMRMHYDTQQSELNEAQVSRVAEVQRLTEELCARNEELAALRAQSDESQLALDIKNATLEAQLEEAREQLCAAQKDKDDAVAVAREELIHEHKTEIESLRCRFKLMTSMERSPSDTSLEKLDRPSSRNEQNVIDLMQHEELLAQQRALLDAEKERAISAALDEERSKWQAKIFPMNSESVMANVSILRDMLEDKERQLDLLREQDKILTRENFQLKTRLDALTNEEASSWLKEKIEYLNRDKCRLEEELTMEKSRRLEMETSVAALKCSTYEQGGLLKGSGGISGAVIPSSASGTSHRYISLETVAKGDLVFIVWSFRNGQYVVVQDSLTLHFVHPDSLPALNLRVPPTPATDAPYDYHIPLPYYAIGRIIDMEYCQARKDKNRYHVAKGTKFYRIKLAPLSSRAIARRERLESFTMPISRSVSQGDSSHSESGTVVAALTVRAPPTFASGTTAYDVSSGTVASDVVDSKTNKDVFDVPDAATICSQAQPEQQQPTTTVAVTTSTAASISTASMSAAAAMAIATPAMMAATLGSSNLYSVEDSSIYHSFKERTASITSVNEEDDDERQNDERSHYISVSEEDDGGIAATHIMATSSPSSLSTSVAATNASTAVLAAAISTTSNLNTIGAQMMKLATQTQQQQTVITEQPTASSSNLMNLNLLLASAVIPTENVANIRVPTSSSSLSSSISSPIAAQEIPAPATTPLPPQTLAPTASPESSNDAVTIDTGDTITLAATAATIEMDEDNASSSSSIIASGSACLCPNPSVVIIAPTTTTSTSAAIQLSLENPIDTTVVTSTIISSTTDNATTACAAPSIGTASEDSESEYRSLEGKDDTDFPICE